MMNGTTNKIEPQVLIEGPRWGDAEFYGKWMLAVATAQELWKEAQNDPAFIKQIELVTICYIPDFGMGAIVMLSKLEKNLASFALGENDADVFDEFVMMAEMGFFVLTGERYQMVIPTKLDIETVKAAMLKYTRTEEEEYGLHPEDLVATMPYAQAKEWQARLRQMDEDHRCADRILLLESFAGR
jgi:hypothetical protein